MEGVSKSDADSGLDQHRAFDRMAPSGSVTQTDNHDSQAAAMQPGAAVRHETSHTDWTADAVHEPLSTS